MSDFAGEEVKDALLDDAFERAGAKGWVVAFLWFIGEMIACSSLGLTERCRIEVVVLAVGAIALHQLVLMVRAIWRLAHTWLVRYALAAAKANIVLLVFHTLSITFQT